MTKPRKLFNPIVANQNMMAPIRRDLMVRTVTVDDILNRNELISIKALTSYVAYNKNVPEDVVRNYLLAEFNVPDISALRYNDYERAIRFLVDLQANLLIH